MITRKWTRGWLQCAARARDLLASATAPVPLVTCQRAAGCGQTIGGDLPCPASIRDPLTIGTSPAADSPLQVDLWDETGAKVIAVTGGLGDGAIAVLDDVAERVTACPDAILLQASPASVRHDRAWAPAAAASGLGDPGRTRLILGFACEVIRLRSRSCRDTRVHQPAPDAPLFVVKVGDAGRRSPSAYEPLLGAIAAQGRTEGVALAAATARTQLPEPWLGPDRMYASWVLWSDSPGVFNVANAAAGARACQGCPFRRSTSEVEMIAAARARRWAEYKLEPALAELQDLWAEITGGEHHSRSHD